MKSHYDEKRSNRKRAGGPSRRDQGSKKRKKKEKFTKRASKKKKPVGLGSRGQDVGARGRGGGKTIARREGSSVLK